MKISQILKFRKQVLDYYKKAGRHNLPWRKTQDPYRILVSEMMLQQTQVARVIPKYHVFLERFPTVEALANASLADVLRLWSGLGYNRRAKFLHMAAKEMVTRHGGAVPRDLAQLCNLPGIGPYTARAVLAFAFDEPEAFIETNIRTVFVHHFFPRSKKVPDAQLLPLIKQALPPASARLWYAALMDYGAYLKTIHTNPSRRSAHYTKQSRFEGSVRQARGAIMRAFTDLHTLSETVLAKKTALSESRLGSALQGLLRDQLITEVKRGVWKIIE